MKVKEGEVKVTGGGVNKKGGGVKENEGRYSGKMRKCLRKEWFRWGNMICSKQRYSCILKAYLGKKVRMVGKCGFLVGKYRVLVRK